MLKNEDELLTCLEEYIKRNACKEALKLIEENYSLIVKKYYQICKIKIQCLIKLEEYIDASIIIKEELGVPYIPLEFENFLKESQKFVFNKLHEKKQSTLTIEQLEKIDQVDDQRLVAMLSYLKDYNLKPFINKFQNIFDNKEITNITKTLLIACLSDYQLDANFDVIKENTHIKFNPISVFDIRSGENFVYLNNELRNIEKLEINTLEFIIKLAMTYLLDIYPLVISEARVEYLLASCLLMTHSALNLQITDKKYLRIIAENEGEIRKVTKKLNELIENV